MIPRRPQHRANRGAVLLETVMFAPILLMLLLGMTELARIAYTYYALQKALYTVARYVGTQQGVNFCDSNDASVVAAKNLAVTGTTDGSGTALVSRLTVDSIALRPERYDSVGGVLGECDCSPTGCDASNGALPPDFIVAYMPDGYTVQPLFLKLSVTAFQLRPHVRVPYGGT